MEVVTYMCPNEGCWLEKIATPQEKDTPPHPHTHNSHHLCRSAFPIISMCLMFTYALGHKVLCLLSRIDLLMCLVEAGHRDCIA